MYGCYVRNTSKELKIGIKIITLEIYIFLLKDFYLTIKFVKCHTHIKYFLPKSLLIKMYYIFNFRNDHLLKIELSIIDFHFLI